MDCASRQREPRPIEFVLDHCIHCIYEAMFSFQGREFPGWFRDLRAKCEALGNYPEVTGEPLRILGALRHLLDNFDLTGYENLSPVEAAETRAGVCLRICEELSTFCAAGIALCRRFPESLDRAARGFECVAQMIEVDRQIRADTEQATQRRLVLENVRACFWYRPNRVRWALACLEHAVDLQAEQRLVTASREDIFDRAARLRGAGRRLLKEEHSLFGLEIQNQGAHPCKFDPTAGLFRIWLGDKLAHAPGTEHVDANLTVLPVLFKDEPGDGTRDSLACRVASLSDGEWDFHMDGVIVSPAERHIGIVAFEGKIDHVDMAGLRKDNGYLGAQPSFYLRPT